MLRCILDAYGSALPSDVHVVFANTGKERNETLDFVRDCADQWGVKVTWLEYALGESYREVTHETASRNGEPFTALMRHRGFLPNPVTRFCTQELKIGVMRNFMRALGYDHWTNVVGLRADEPGRVARAKGSAHRERYDISTPLDDAGVTEDAVLAFWKAQPFDLRLRSWEGNCDLCFLKGRQKRMRIMRDNPELALWWIEAEAEARASKPSGASFRSDSPRYSALLKMAQEPMLPFDACDLDGIDGLTDCMCTD